MSIPGAPTSVVATAGNAMTRVSWQPGEGDGVPAIYTVTPNSGSAVTVTTPAGGLQPPLQAIFPGLANGTPVYYVVTATNTDGTSPASVASNTVTPAVQPGNLPNIFDSICAWLAYDMTTAGVGNPPEMHFGLNFKRENSYFPRIVMIPTTGVGNTWRGRGSTHLGTGISAGSPKQIGERQQIVEAWIWAGAQPTADAERDDTANYGYAEQLANYLIASVKHALNGTELPEWFSFPKSDGSLDVAGCSLALRFLIKIPMTDYAPTSVVLTSLPLTASMTGVALNITPFSPSVVAGNTQQFAAQGGTELGFVWTLSANNSGGSIDSSGLYTAGAISGVSDTVQVTDSGGNVATTPVSVLSALTFALLPQLVVSPAVGFDGFTWAIVINATGATINASTGVYMPGTVDGIDTVTVTDSATNICIYFVTRSGSSNTVSHLKCEDGGGINFAGQAGTVPYSFDLPVNNSGGSIDPSSGAYAAGDVDSVTDTVRLTDSGSPPNVATLPVDVVAHVAISPSDDSVGTGTHIAFSASDGFAPYVFSLFANHSGATINASTGAYVAGATPTGLDMPDVVEVIDAAGFTSFANVTVT